MVKASCKCLKGEEIRVVLDQSEAGRALALLAFDLSSMIPGIPQGPPSPPTTILKWRARSNPIPKG